MSDKKDGVIDLSDIAKPLVEDYAQELGRRVPKMLEGLEAWLQSHGLKVPADVIEMAREALSNAPKELIEMAAGVITVPRKIFPPGKIGDVLHKYANDAVDEIGRGASEKSKPADGKSDGKDGKKDAKDAGKTSDKAGGTPADPKERLGYVVNGRWYPANCSHVARPWGNKGQKPPEDITLAEALARKHSYCPDCIRDLAPAAPKAEAKPDAKADEQKIAFKEHPLPSAEHTLFDLWKRFSDDDEKEHDGSTLLSRGRWAEFVRRTDHDLELRGKFILAFNRRGTYDQFKRLVLASPADWDRLLDILLGQTKHSASYLKQKAEEEREQWSKALKGVTAWLKRGIVEGQRTLDAARARTEALKKQAQGKKYRKPVDPNDGSPDSDEDPPSHKGMIFTIVSLAILLGSIAVMWSVLT